MSKIQTPFGEWEPGTDPRSKDLDKWIKEQQGDTSMTESAEGQRLKGERGDIVDRAYRQGRMEEKKPEEKKTVEKTFFESIREQLAPVKKTLEQYNKKSPGLEEFERGIDSWEKEISIKESDPHQDDEYDDAEEIKREFSGVRGRLRELHHR